MFLSILFILLAGVAMPVSGIQFQHSWRNQLGDVYSLGLGSAACLGGAWAAMSGVDIYTGAMVACLLCTLITSLFASKLDIKHLITFGLVFGSVVGSFGTICANNATPEALQAYYRWAGASFNLLPVPPMMLILSLLLFVIGAIITLMTIHLPDAPQGWKILGASLWVTSVITVCGIIGMISLTVPNVVRLIWRDCSLKRECIWSSLLSIALLGITFVLVQCISSIYLPISALLSLVSAPLLIFTLRSKENK